MQLRERIFKINRSLRTDGLRATMGKVKKFGTLSLRDTVARRSLRIARKLGVSPEQSLKEWSYIANPLFQITEKDIEKSKRIQRQAKPTDIRTATWFVPYFEHLAFGGIHTIFRFIDGFAKQGITPRIIIFDRSGLDIDTLREKIGASFPALKNCILETLIPGDLHLNALQATDIAFCTTWQSAYYLLRFNKTQRKYYFIQDYEALFYPAGSMYALAESTYRFGHIGLVNTPGLFDAIQKRHGLEGMSFMPAVHKEYKPAKKPKKTDRIRIFFYARQSVFAPRNAFELGVETIRQLVIKYGSKIEIVTAGSAWNEDAYELKGQIINLGLLPGIKEVAELYRSCDIGFVYMLTKHPSYQPFEFMASGMATVSNRNEDTQWFLKDGENCLLAEPSPADMAQKIGKLIDQPELRKKIQAKGFQCVNDDWEDEVHAMYKKIVQREEVKRTETIRVF